MMASRPRTAYFTPAMFVLRGMVAVAIATMIASCFNLSSADADEGSGGITKLIALTAPLTILLLYTPWVDWLRARPFLEDALRLFAPLLMLYVFGLVSAAWSPFPDQSVIRSIVMIIAVLSIISLGVLMHLAFPRDGLAAIRFVVIVSCATAAFMMLYAHLSPAIILWRDNRLGGAVISVNILGAMALILAGLPIVLLMNGRARPLMALAALASLYVWYLTFSRGALSGFFAGFLLIFARGFWRQRMSTREVIGAAVGVAIVLLVLVIDPASFLSALLRDGQSASDLATGTNRTLVWAAIIEHLTFASILIGHGFYMLSGTGTVIVGALNLYHAHNGYMQTLAGTGAVGLVLVFAFLVRAGRVVFSADTCMPTEGRKCAMFLYTFFVVSNISEASVSFQIYPQFLLTGLLLMTVVGAQALPRARTARSAAGFIRAEHQPS